MTLGEILAKAGLDTLMGMGSVFIMLIIISIIIYAMKFVPQGNIFKREKKGWAHNNTAGAEKAETETVAPKGGIVKGTADAAEGELVAVITAAIAAHRARMAVPAQAGNEYVVRSIRRRR